MKKNIVLTFSLLSFSAIAQMAPIANMTYTQPKKSTADTIKENLSFTYFTNVLGPTIERNKNGATYNRFKSGKDYYGNKLDATDNMNYFSSFALSYRINPKVNIGYSYAYDDTFDQKSKYQYVMKVDDYKNYKKVGSHDEIKTGERFSGKGYYNQRVNFFFPNIAENDKISFSTGFSYEMPTSQASKDNDMIYGLVLSPTLALKVQKPGLFVGFTSLIQRDYYRNNSVYLPNCDGCFPNEMQTLRVNVGHYANYMLNDKWTLQNTTIFDWDQRGKNTNTNKFGNNMDDVIRFGTVYRFNQYLTAGPYTQAVIFNPRLNTTVIGLTLSMTI